MDAIVIGIVALITGLALGWKRGAKFSSAASHEVSRAQAIDRANFLQTLRRELANILVWRNPQRYLQLYHQINDEVKSLESCRPEAVRARLAELCKKYPEYRDFDVVATREYVLYAEGVSIMDDDELEGHYRDLVMFAALSANADEAWKLAGEMFIHTTSDKELAHLTKYIQRIEDTKLQLRIERAIDDNRLSRKDDGRNLNNDYYAIVNLPHFAENRYGVHLKRTNEFAIYSFFVFDDGRVSYSLYRSEPTYEKEQPLEPLEAVMEEIKLTR